MNTMFIMFSRFVTICCVENGQCYLYGEYELGVDTLDVLYRCIIESKVEKVILVMQGMWSADSFGESYQLGKLRVKNNTYTGYVNSQDVNKFIHTIRQANSSAEIQICDKFELYRCISDSEHSNLCIIDYYDSSVLLVVCAQGNEFQLRVTEIEYTSLSKLPSYLARIKQRCPNVIFKNVQNMDKMNTAVDVSRLPEKAQFKASLLTALLDREFMFKLDISAVKLSADFMRSSTVTPAEKVSEKRTIENSKDAIKDKEAVLGSKEPVKQARAGSVTKSLISEENADTTKSLNSRENGVSDLTNLGGRSQTIGKLETQQFTMGNVLIKGVITLAIVISLFLCLLYDTVGDNFSEFIEQCQFIRFTM